MNKVYCKKCIHFRQHHRRQVCNLSKYTVDRPHGQYDRYKSCCVLNKNNGCMNYEERWLVSFSAKFKGPIDESINNRFEILDL
jgi:hypothetical protein